MAATSPDAAGPSGRGEGDGRGDRGGDAAVAAGAPPPPLAPPPLGLDTAPLLAALGLLDGDGEGDEDDGLDTGEVVLREGERERRGNGGGRMPQEPLSPTKPSHHTRRFPLSPQYL